MTSKPITIAEEYFPSRAAAIRRLKALLHSGGVDDLITRPADTALLAALFHSRPEKVAELKGCSIVGWGRVPNWDQKHQYCTISFAAVLDAGAKIGFSRKESLDALYAAQATEA